MKSADCPINLAWLDPTRRSAALAGMSQAGLQATRKLLLDNLLDYRQRRAKYAGPDGSAPADPVRLIDWVNLNREVLRYEGSLGLLERVLADRRKTAAI